MDTGRLRGSVGLPVMGRRPRCHRSEFPAPDARVLGHSARHFDRIPDVSLCFGLDAAGAWFRIGRLRSEFLALGVPYTANPFMAFAAEVMVAAGYPRFIPDRSIDETVQPETVPPIGISIVVFAVGTVLTVLGTILEWIAGFNAFALSPT